MGDLSERYASSLQYLRDVARMLPVLVAAEACVLAIAFISSPGASFTPASIAVVAVALAVLTLRDAYAYPREISKREALLDAVAPHASNRTSTNQGCTSCRNSSMLTTLRTRAIRNWSSMGTST